MPDTSNNPLKTFTNHFFPSTRDFQYMEKLQPSLSRLTGNKTVELLTPSASGVQVSSYWPTTLTISLETLRVVTKPAASPKTRRYSDRRLELIPSTSSDSNADYSHSFQKLSETSELTILQNDRWVMQHVHGPGYVGIKNLGATGYVSCVVQILYMLMPFRKVSTFSMFRNVFSHYMLGNPANEVPL